MSRFGLIGNTRLTLDWLSVIATSLACGSRLAGSDTLQSERGIGFEDVLEAIETGRILADEAHPNPESYGHQRILVVEIDGYACVVPYVQQGNRRFLKTIYRSRVYQRKYLGSRRP